MKKTVSFLSAFLLFAATAVGQSKDEKQVAEAVESFRQWMIKLNKTAVENLIAESRFWSKLLGCLVAIICFVAYPSVSTAILCLQ